MELNSENEPFIDTTIGPKIRNMTTAELYKHTWKLYYKLYPEKKKKEIFKKSNTKKNETDNSCIK